MLICKIFTFDASHQLPLPEEHKCSKLHGHTYKLEVFIKGPINKDGVVIDFGIVKDKLIPLIEESLDHCHLNDLMVNPTAENLTIWIYTHFRKSIPEIAGIRLWETPNAYAQYLGE